MGDLFSRYAYVHTYVPEPVTLRNVDNSRESCGFPVGQLSCICSEGSMVRDLQP